MTGGDDFRHFGGRWKDGNVTINEPSFMHTSPELNVAVHRYVELLEQYPRGAGILALKAELEGTNQKFFSNSS